MALGRRQNLEKAMRRNRCMLAIHKQEIGS